MISLLTAADGSSVRVQARRKSRVSSRAPGLVVGPELAPAIVAISITRFEGDVAQDVTHLSAYRTFR
jgi:hypothetical protein